MSITLQCVNCRENCITLHQSEGGIKPWFAICKDCYAQLVREHDDRSYGSPKPEA